MMPAEPGNNLNKNRLVILLIGHTYYTRVELLVMHDLGYTQCGTIPLKNQADMENSTNKMLIKDLITQPDVFICVHVQKIEHSKPKLIFTF